ncbi:MAG: hypothetical protein AMS18_10380 [Gemmatimonas sp. SG8_17]|nr:MAG: hypothetical protein AMS18_10380 [Gemmatimonas sp. SG8_17]
MRQLDSLRAELSGVDNELLELITRRQVLAAEIGMKKLEAGLPTRDFSRERIVLEQARLTAANCGLNQELAEKVTLLLIEASLTVQEQDRVTRRAGGHGQRALVIGGAGKMGGWMARYLGSQGYEIEIADLKDSAAGYRNVHDWQASPLDHDIIVLATPLRVTQGILMELAASPPSGLIFDVGSLKTPLRTGLLRLAEVGAQVTSVHPMFGPDTQLLSGRHVIFVDLGISSATQRARELFDSTMALQVEMDLDSHDRVIAYVLGLSHAVNIAFFTALAQSGEEIPHLTEFSSTTFDAQLEVATAVSAENPHLYFEIQSMNDYGSAPLDALVAAVARIREVVRNQDEASFVRLMNRGRTYLQVRARR